MAASRGLQKKLQHTHAKKSGASCRCTTDLKVYSGFRSAIFACTSGIIIAAAEPYHR